MSARFWLLSMASAGAALVSGLGLGLYATTPPRVAFSDYEDTAPSVQERSEAPDWAALSGPAHVRCTGCGPTLAQRQMAAMMGGWDGYDDPVVRDYEAQNYDEPEDLLADVPAAPPPPAHRLPPNVERFATGGAADPQPMELVQAEGFGVSGSPVTIQP